MKLQKMAVPLLVLLLVVCCIVLLVLDGKDSGTTTTTTAATTKEKYNAYSMDYFDTVTQITGYTETKEEFDAISKRVFRCVDLSLGFLFCSIDLYFCLCASTILSFSVQYKQSL